MNYYSDKTQRHEHIEIRAVYTDHSVRVYQAFREEIAEEAVRLGTFGPHFGIERMTWIKPSFLWMMYRSGWAQKEGQEHILAIDIKRDAFDWLLENAMLSVYFPNCGMTQEEWSRRVKQSDVRCQWDPERDPHGRPLPWRSVQLGIRRKVSERYVGDWILHIDDITPLVKTIKQALDNDEDISALLPREEVYPMTQAARDNFACVIKRGKKQDS
jgi:hypothetical protein